MFLFGGVGSVYFKLFYLLTLSRKTYCEENISWLNQSFKAYGTPLQDQPWSHLHPPPPIPELRAGKEASVLL